MRLREYMKKAGDPCPYCKRVLSKAWVQDRDERVKANARLSAKKAKASGNKGGRPRLRPDKLIRHLRSEGLSIRAIASKIGFSPTAVQRSIRET